MSEEPLEALETDLVERVETTRFLGPEFLVWLWFKSEVCEAVMARADGSPLELWLDSQLTLRSASDAGERVVFRGIAPTATPEAKLALAHNKWPTVARVSMTVEGRDFAFSFDAESFSFGSVKLPQILADDSDEAFLERMSLLELLGDVVGELYGEFLSVRTTALWDAELVPWLKLWLAKAELPSAKALAGLVRRAASQA